MKLLYVSPVWTGIRSTIYEGNASGSGMPAFLQPLKYLLTNHHHVDLILFENRKTIPDLEPAEWLQHSTITIKAAATNRLGRVVSYARFYKYLRGVIEGGDYDFVYGHGLPGVVGTIAANRAAVPTGQRLYGTFLTQHLKANAHVSSMKHSPLEYCAFRTSKDFLLMTNDGTKGDLVYSQIGSSKYEFYFWHNGVDFSSSAHPKPNGSYAGAPYLLYPGRIAEWKRQHYAIELIASLRHEYGVDITLKFAGQTSDSTYRDYLEHLSHRLAVSDLIRFLGPVPRLELSHMYSEAVAVLSFYELSNLGNVVIESLAAGAVVVSLEDGSLDSVITDGINGVLISTPTEGAQRIHQLMQDVGLRTRLGSEARRIAKAQFMSWHDRAALETALVQSAVSRRQSPLR